MNTEDEDQKLSQFTRNCMGLQANSYKPNELSFKQNLIRHILPKGVTETSSPLCSYQRYFDFEQIKPIQDLKGHCKNSNEDTLDYLHYIDQHTRYSTNRPEYKKKLMASSLKTLLNNQLNKKEAGRISEPQEKYYPCGLTNYQIIQAIYPVWKSIMAEDSPINQRRNISFLFCFLIYHLRTLQGLQDQMKRKSIAPDLRSPHFQTFHKEKIIANFENIAKYCEQYLKEKVKLDSQEKQQETQFLFFLINKRTLNHDYVDAIWILYKFYAMNSLQTFQLQPKADLNLDSSIEMVRYFQKLLINDVASLYLQDEPSLGICYEYSIKHESGVQKARCIIQKEEDKQSKQAFLERIKRIIKQVNLQYRDYSRQFIHQEELIIYINPQLYKSSLAYPQIDYRLKLEKHQHFYLNKDYQIAVQQLKQYYKTQAAKQNGKNLNFQIYYCNQYHIICIACFKDREHMKKIQQNSRIAYIRYLKTKKLTKDVKIHSGKYGIIKIMILRFDQDSFDWGGQYIPIPQEQQQGYFNYLRMSVFHQLRRQKHMLLLTLDLPALKITEQAMKKIRRILNIQPKDKPLNHKIILIQYFFNIFLNMLQRHMVCSPHPIHHATTLYVVYYLKQLLQTRNEGIPSDKITYEQLLQWQNLQQLLNSLSIYIKVMKDHIKTMIGYGIDYEAVDQFEMLEEMENSQQNLSAAKKYQRSYQMMNRTFQTFKEEPVFYKYSSFWTFLQVSRKILQKAKKSKQEKYQQIIARQIDFCQIYNEEGAVMLELYILVIIHGKSIIQDLLQRCSKHKQTIKLCQKCLQLQKQKDKEDIYQQIVLPWLNAKQTARNIIENFLYHKKIVKFESICLDMLNVIQDSISSSLIQKHFPLTPDMNMKIQYLKIYQLRYECKEDCELCKVYQIYQPDENCFQRFASIIKQIRGGIRAQKEMDHSDKELMQRYKKYMTSIYNL